MQQDGRTLPLFLLAIALLTGGALLGVRGGQVYLSRLLLLGGAAILVLMLVKQGPTLRFLFFRYRTVAEPGPSFNWMLLGAVLLVASAVFVMQDMRIDMTERQVNRLSDTSRQALSHLTQRVEIVASISATNPDYGRIEQILTAYRTDSDLIRTEIFDPIREPAKAREHGVTQSNVILVRAGRAEETVVSLEAPEPPITQAILRVEDPSRPMVALVIGHGETAPERRGFNQLRDMLVQGGFRFQFLRLAEHIEVPREASVVLLAGPKTPFTPGEVEALDRFLNRGGRIGMFIDPGVDTGLESLLERHRLKIDGRYIRDDSPASRAYDMGPETVVALRDREHDITRALRSGILLRGATGVTFVGQPILGRPQWTLLTSGPQALYLAPPTKSDGHPESESTTEAGEEGIDQFESPSPWLESGTDKLEPATKRMTIPVAAAAEWEVPPAAAGPQNHPVPEKPYGRIVALGDSDIIRDGMIGLHGNPQFITSTVGWLGGKQFLLRFPPSDISGTPLKLDRPTLRTVSILYAVVLPFAIFLLGFITWMRRR